MKIWKYAWRGSWLPSSRWLHTARPKSVGCYTLANYEARWKVEFVDKQMFKFHKLYFTDGFLFIYSVQGSNMICFWSDDTTAAEARETKLNIYRECHKTEEFGYQGPIEISRLDMKTISPKTPRFGNVNTNKPKIPSKRKTGKTISDFIALKMCL